MHAVPDEETRLPKPYSQARLAQRAVGAARRLRVLLAGAGVAFAAFAFVWAASPGPWLLLAAFQGVLVWKLPARPLWVVILATLEVFLALLLPFRAIGLHFMGKPGFESATALAVSLGVLAVAVAALPSVVTLLRDQEFREVYVSLD